MGMEANSDDAKNEIYKNSMKNALSTFIVRTLNPLLWFDFIFRRTSCGISFYKNAKVLTDFSENVSFSNFLFYVFKRHLSI